ncbi:MAG: EAL domain-containing protein, partial [Actinomycetota bacterium]|nr:EAL domain-containing protein [Actinomycetota bacterium]
LRGFEALVRWNHPQRGLVSPLSFIPVAEATGLIVPLGEWVLRTACLQARRWQDDHPEVQKLTMHINISVRQLQSDSIIDLISSALTDAGLSGEQLVLEITESVVMHRGEALTVLKRLHEIGIRVAIDDFGTGYSSLGRLHSLPIDKVKIDKSFVDAIDGDKAAPMVAATIAMAHSLGLETVAEGVESPEQLPFLRLHGCDEVQGYLFGRPVDSASIDALLRDRGTGRLWTYLGGTPPRVQPTAYPAPIR